MSLALRRKLKFGEWQGGYAADTVYQAASDGFVLAVGWNSGTSGGVKGYANTWETIRQWNGSGYLNYGAGICMPVSKGHTWRVEQAGCVAGIFFIPLI